ncbi:hypothetical protein KSZ_47720 [Dictyobacter formicarum]|uniref:Uncharacterized protein n=1 Tax=Dictyobacter formicarum TaxID=2778368 RepID=A0ABQ3VM58_9CHLR|nr:hypothetical protein KSZ_47720 [Dictyobacter formicarum]
MCVTATLLSGMEISAIMRGIDGFHRLPSLLHIHIMNMLIQPAVETEDITTAHFIEGRFCNEAA